MGNLVTLEDARAERAAAAEAEAQAETPTDETPAESVTSTTTGQTSLVAVRGMGGKRPSVEAVSLKGASAKLPKMLTIPKGSTVTLTITGTVSGAGEFDKLDKEGFIEQTIRQVVIDCDEMLVQGVIDGDGNSLVENGLRVRGDVEPDDAIGQEPPAGETPADDDEHVIEAEDVEVIDETPAAAPAFFCDKATGEVVGTTRDEVRAWLDTQAVENADGLDELLALNADLIAERIEEGQAKVDVAATLIVEDVFDWGAILAEGDEPAAESPSAAADPVSEPSAPVKATKPAASDTGPALGVIEGNVETYTETNLTALKKHDLTALYAKVTGTHPPSSLSTKPKLVAAIVEFVAQMGAAEAPDVAPVDDPQAAVEAGDPPAPADDDDPFAPITPDAETLAGMQRSQLVQLSNQLGVVTSSTDTKSEIIAAIEAAR